MLIRPSLFAGVTAVLIASPANAGSAKDGVVAGSTKDVVVEQREGIATHCYRRVQTAPVYRTVGRKVLVRPARNEIRFIPAVYGMRGKNVMTAPGRRAQRHTPAVYVTRAKRVLVQAGRTHYRTVPAVYRDIHQTRIIEPASIRWEHRGLRRKLCKVVVPARTETFTRRVMVSPERRVAVHERAVYRTHHERILVKPAETKLVHIAPQFALSEERVLIAPARREKVIVPPVYGMHYDNVLVKPAGRGWRATPPC